MPETHSMDHDASRRSEVERLLELALKMLDQEREQIVGDYLGHALNALGYIRQTEGANRLVVVPGIADHQSSERIDVDGDSILG